MSMARYLQIKDDVRSGLINPDLQPTYSGLRGVNPIVTPPAKLVKHDIPAKVFTTPLIGLSVGARRRRRPIPKAKPAVFDGYIKRGIRVFICR